MWSRLGPVTHYVEPFCGGAAILLARPIPAGLEVVSDSNFYIANFWRCVKFQPHALASWANYPVSHIDAAARHRWLTDPGRTSILVEHLMDPEWAGDPQLGGWWVWGQCLAIGGNWCVRGEPRGDGLGSIPLISCPGRGLQAIPPDSTESFIISWIYTLSRRLERVRIIHGDFERCLNLHYGDCHGGAGVFLDPPYKQFERMYGKETEESVAMRAENWARRNQHRARIALCGFRGDYDLPGWEIVEWSRPGMTMGSDKTRDLEAIWFSPRCLPQPRQKELFDETS